MYNCVKLSKETKFPTCVSYCGGLNAGNSFHLHNKQFGSSSFGIRFAKPKCWRAFTHLVHMEVLSWCGVKKGGSICSMAWGKNQ